MPERIRNQYDENFTNKKDDLLIYLFVYSFLVLIILGIIYLVKLIVG